MDPDLRHEITSLKKARAARRAKSRRTVNSRDLEPAIEAKIRAMARSELAERHYFELIEIDNRLRVERGLKRVRPTILRSDSPALRAMKRKVQVDHDALIERERDLAARAKLGGPVVCGHHAPLERTAYGKFCTECGEKIA